VGVGVVVWREERFILVRRGKEPNRGQWSIPGGAQKLGETVYAAAAREVLEETGLHVQVSALVDVVDGIMTDEEGAVNYHYTLVDLVAESPQGEPVAGDDAAAVAWFKLEDLPGLALWSETDRIIRDSVAKRRP
jgi:8-oxo-dGTP diphosphatase